MLLLSARRLENAPHCSVGKMIVPEVELLSFASTA